jgi:hypothetical protein
MATLFIGDSANAVPHFDVTPYVKSLVVDTEEDKGFSTCTFELASASLATLPIGNITGKHEIVVREGGDLIWAGRVSSLARSGEGLSVEAVGYFDLLNDYFYDDWSETYNTIDSQTPVATASTVQLDGTPNAGFAVELENVTGRTVPVLSFIIELQRTGNPVGKVNLFISNFSGTTVSYQIEASAISETKEFYEAKVEGDYILDPAETFYVGISADTTYTSGFVAGNYIDCFYNSVGSGGNVYQWTGAAWVAQVTKEAYAVSIARGLWDYSPGAYQDEILEDIMTYYELTFGEEIPLNRIYANSATTFNQLPYFNISPDETAYEAVKKVLVYGNNASGDYKPFCFYIYKGHYYESYFYVDTIDYTREPIALINLTGERNNEDLSFNEMSTQVKVVYKDVDGFRQETTAYYTNIPSIYYKEKRITINEATDAAADIVAQYNQEIEKNPKGERTIDLVYGDVQCMSQGGPFPLHRLRAGQIIAVANGSRIFQYGGANAFWTKYFIRSTSYDCISKTMSVDLSRQADKERLLELIQQ